VATCAPTASASMSRGATRSSPTEPAFMQLKQPTQGFTFAGTCIQLDLKFFGGLLELNFGAHVAVQKAGKDGDNGRVTVEGSFGAALTVGAVPGVFVGSFVGQGFARVSANPPLIKRDGSKAGQSTLAQAKWVLTEWLKLKLSKNRIYQWFRKFRFSKTSKQKKIARIDQMVERMKKIHKMILSDDEDDGDSAQSLLSDNTADDVASAKAALSKAENQLMKCKTEAQQAIKALEGDENSTSLQQEVEKKREHVSEAQQQVEWAKVSLKSASGGKLEGRLTNAAGWLHMHFLRELANICNSTKAPKTIKEWNSKYVQKAWRRVYLGDDTIYKTKRIKCKTRLVNGQHKNKINKQYVKPYAPKPEPNCNHRLQHYLEEGKCMERGETGSASGNFTVVPKVPSDTYKTATQALVCAYFSYGSLLDKPKSEMYPSSNINDMMPLAYPELFPPEQEPESEVGDEESDDTDAPAKMSVEDIHRIWATKTDRQTLNDYFDDINVESFKIYEAYATLFKTPEDVSKQLKGLLDAKEFEHEAERNKSPCQMTAEFQFDTTMTFGSSPIGFCSGADTNAFRYIKSRQWTWDSDSTSHECKLGTVNQKPAVATANIALGNFLYFNFISTVGRPEDTTVGMEVWLDGSGRDMLAAAAGMMSGVNIPAKVCDIPNLAASLRKVFRTVLSPLASLVVGKASKVKRAAVATAGSAAGMALASGLGGGVMTAMASVQAFLKELIPNMLKVVGDLLGKFDIGKKILAKLNVLNDAVKAVRGQVAKSVQNFAKSLGIKSPVNLHLFKQTQILYQLNPSAGGGQLSKLSTEGDDLSITDTVLLGLDAAAPVAPAMSVQVQQYAHFGQGAICGDEDLTVIADNSTELEKRSRDEDVVVGTGGKGIAAHENLHSGSRNN